MQASWFSLKTYRRPALHVVLIILSCCAVYANSLYVPFIMDDEIIPSFGKNDFLDILLHRGFRRVTDVTFALNYHLHGIQVTGYHLINLLIHIAASLSLYALVLTCFSALRQSFPAPEAEGSPKDTAELFIPLATALLFAVHPLQTQAVTYIIQRYTSLATLFYLLSVLFFVKGRLAWEKGGSLRQVCGVLLFSLLAALLAVGSKQIAFTLPLMLIVVELFLFRGRLINRRFFLASGGLCLIVLVWVLFTWRESSLSDFLYDLHNATAEDPQISRYTYFLTQTRVVVTYLRLLCLPYGQSLIHSSPLYSTLLSVPVLASLFLHCILLAAAVLLFRVSDRKFRSGNNREQAIMLRLASLGIVWFYVALLIESSFFPIMDVIFEHRVYLPSAGFFMAAAAVILWCLHGRQAGLKHLLLLLAILVTLLGGLAIARNRVWNDSLRLYLDAATKSPNNVLAITNLGDEYLLRGMPDQAVRALVRAIELKPNLDAFSKVYLGEALQKLRVSNSRFTTGKEYVLPNGEVHDYRFAGVAFNNLGLAYEFLGEPEKALRSYRKALLVMPDYDLAWFNLGLFSASTGDVVQARAALVRLKQFNPSLANELESIVFRQ